MKVYMLCDMEGVSGIYARDQVWRSGERPELYDEGRWLMTRDVNAAAEAALAAGVDELVVCDTHSGGGRNVLWNEMLNDLRVMYEVPHAPRLLPGLDESFDGVILLGHHAKAGTLGAFLDHTWSGQWFDFQINGQSVGEVGIETCYAGHWDVPLIMVQGDEACCAEVEEQFPQAVTATVKRGLDRFHAAGPSPDVARQWTADKVAEAVERARGGGLSPFKPTLPMTVRWTAATTDLVDRVAYRSGVRRVDARTVECQVARQCDVLAWLV
jgi:D-amino peptidase